MYELMAETGHAPTQGCLLIGVGYEDAFARLREKYFRERFRRGDSSEKFIVGPYGSGKTLFLRQLMEIGRSLDCVTSEIALNKDIDVTKSLHVFRAVVNSIQSPTGDSHGLPNLLRACLERVQSKADVGDGGTRALAEAWVAGIENADFKVASFAKVARQAFQAELAADEMAFDTATRWLSGEVSNRELAKQLGTSPIPEKEQTLYGLQAMLALFQLIRHAGFAGTVIGYDEAEQGLSVDKKRWARILSLLQSGINAVSDLRNGSALIVYAVTQDLREKMQDFPALQQRIADPGEGMGFFDGPNTLAPTIDLTQRRAAPEDELRQIGQRLVTVFFDHVPEATRLDKKQLTDRIVALAAKTATTEASVSNRRTMVKTTCALLLTQLDSSEAPS
jgi:hypothetical protein